MDTGWIKLHRKSLESIIFTNEKGWKIWTWCLLKANHEKNEFFLGRSKISLKSGQFVMGRNIASQELGMAVGTIWYWLDILEKEGNIERKSTNKYTIITILKWDSYQIVERRLNADRTQIEQQIEPNKNDKNDKNESEHTQAFEFFTSKEKQVELFKWLISTGIEESLARTELWEFIKYWKETNAKGKERWQGQKFFDVKRRIGTWFKNIK